MTRYFKNNQEYFNFINKYKDKYSDRLNIEFVKILKNKIKVIYNITN
jgi:hypothetical protein